MYFHIDNEKDELLTEANVRKALTELGLTAKEIHLFHNQPKPKPVTEQKEIDLESDLGLDITRLAEFQKFSQNSLFLKNPGIADEQLTGTLSTSELEKDAKRLN